MLDILGSWKNLATTTQQHLATIQAQREFDPLFVVQFQLAYSDFRTVQLALQLADELALLKRYTQAYNAVYEFELAYVAGGLANFNAQFGSQIAKYQTAVKAFQEVLNEIKQLQPKDESGLV